MGEVRVTAIGDASGFAQTISARHHHLTSDEPLTVQDATDTGPSPYELLLAALGAEAPSPNVAPRVTWVRAG